MKKEGTIGAATLLAIAAVVGVSLQTGPKPDAKADQNTPVKRSKPSLARTKTHEVRSGCSDLKEQLEEFLEVKELVVPEPCYKKGDAPDFRNREDLTPKVSQLKFVIATLPDPVHTHLAEVFDQFSVALQEGAQDEQYDFDSSWLPWDDQETNYALLLDEKAANEERELKEQQPGIILFRKGIRCAEPNEKDNPKHLCKADWGTGANTNEVLAKPYLEGLVVFVVGEEATHGIHRDQFRSALSWIEALKPKSATSIGPLAILGPTFSGSYPSIVQVLSEPDAARQLNLPPAPGGRAIDIFSGSVSGYDSARAFQEKMDSKVIFHSFVQQDDEILRRFCAYLAKEQPGFDLTRVAMISEDETAYGSSGIETAYNNKGERLEGDSVCHGEALQLFYPRDISALRGAYQTKSLFDVGTSSQAAETQKKSLPSDLADPSGKVHDSIRSYGGNQTPLNQEAFLLQIVAALREFRAQYVLLRGSSTLDQLFLTNFLRRGYPDARIVIFGSDLMFIRERGSTGLGGVMTLSTYPLFPLERDWTEHQSLAAADRVFSGDTIEGTYVAFRLLLNGTGLNGEKTNSDRCHVKEKDAQGMIFLPPVVCEKDPPIPDYSAPFWMLANQCGEMTYPNESGLENKGEKCPYGGPATWLSVIGVNRFWPMAALTSLTPMEAADSRDLRQTPRDNQRNTEPGGTPTMPVGMRLFLFALVGFSFFHALCCRFGSYTAKPAFRAHFATTGDRRHRWLVFGGSYCVALLAVVTGWGCGLFYRPATGLSYPRFALIFVGAACLMAWGAIVASTHTAWRLSRSPSGSPNLSKLTKEYFFDQGFRDSGLFFAAIALFCVVFVFPVEYALLPENRVLTYWRAMHLTSGVSPLVPILLVFVGIYLSFWFTLHGLALFGPDRPCLPPRETLSLQGKYFLRMFSQEEGARTIEDAALPLNGRVLPIGVVLFVLFFAIAWGVEGGVPVRSLGARSYSIIFLGCLDACCTLAIVEAWRLCQVWEALKRLLAFLDRLALRRTMAALRGFSWGGVWKMSGNVLEVRYKVISRQMECMNHTIASLELLPKPVTREVQNSLDALRAMQSAGIAFADWYSSNYVDPDAGDMSSFETFQRTVAFASGTLLAKLLVPAWRSEEDSLVVEAAKDEKDEAGPHHPPQPKEKHIQNAEEFVCLNYLGFVQNILGRLRTMALTVMLLFTVATVATSTYPFDPQQALSAVLIVLFVVVGAVIVKVYADMHRDATLSHVTNTRPGELGSEFWFKLVGFGFAPLIGLITKIFPGLTDFVFSWLQPGIASLK